MSLRNFLLAAAALPGLVLAQDGSMCLVKTTVVPVYITTTIGGPAMTTTMSNQGASTAIVVPTPAATFNLATAPAGSTITEGTPIVLVYTAPQPNMAATIDLVQVGPSEYGNQKRDTSVAFVRTITQNAIGGNLTWTPDMTLPTANNYAFRVSQNGAQVQLSNNFVLVAAPMMSSSSSSMAMTKSSSRASNSPPPAGTSTKPALSVTTSMSSAGAPTVTSNPSTSSVKVISTAGVSTINGGGAVVETQYVQGAPKTSVVNTFSTTVTATSTVYSTTSTAVATAVATQTSLVYTSTAVITVTPNAAVATNAKIGGFNGILTVTVTTTAIPQARRGAAGFFGF